MSREFPASSPQSPRVDSRMTPEQVQAWIEECKAKLAEAADPDNHRRP